MPLYLTTLFAACNSYGLDFPGGGNWRKDGFFCGLYYYVFPSARNLNSTLSPHFPCFAHVASLPSFQQRHSSTSLLPFRCCGSVPGFPPYLGTRCLRGFPPARAGSATRRGSAAGRDAQRPLPRPRRLLPCEHRGRSCACCRNRPFKSRLPPLLSSEPRPVPPWFPG